MRKTIQDTKISLVYYSKALTSAHGGRLHSEAFVKEANKHENFKSLLTYPHSETAAKKNIKQGVIKKALKKISLIQILSFFNINRRSFLGISKFLKGKDIDCLHIRMASNFMIIKKLKKDFPDLIVTTEVNASPFDESFKNIPFKNFFKGLEYKYMSMADANFFVSDYLRQSIMTNVDPERDFVVHNGVNLEVFTPIIKESDDKIITFGYVGTLDYHKNLFILIEAFKKVLSETDIKVKLILVGDGPMKKDLLAYIAEKGLSELIELTGWVDHKNIRNQLSRIDIAIHHSANPYMSPLKLFEYLAVGLAVIGPNIPAVKEIFEDGKDLLLTDKNSEDLFKKMMILITEKGLRKQISESGKVKVRSYFGWDRNAKAIMDVIEKKRHVKKYNYGGSGKANTSGSQ